MDKKQAKRKKKQAVIPRTVAQKQVPLFMHLRQEERECSFTQKIGFSHSPIHPSAVRVGLKIAEGKISGSTARCVAMLTAFKDLVRDYTCPVNTVLSRHLEVSLRPSIQFISDCRPLAVSMGNAIKHLKMAISRLLPSLSESEAKETIVNVIDMYIEEHIVVADEVIARLASSKIVDGDVILIFAYSHLVENVLRRARGRDRQFKVVIADSRPKLEGRESLRRLKKYGIPCSYVLVSGITSVMKDVTKVVLGCHAVMSNGTVISRVGTACVAMMAHAFAIPVLVCCESFKFCERVQLDAITFNELGDPDELVHTTLSKRKEDVCRCGVDSKGSTLSDWRDISALKLLNLVYDVTPVEFVDCIVTESGMVPPTSVPVIIREYLRELTIDQ